MFPRVVRRVIRLQRRSPWAALLITATLAVGIGASVLVFSVADPLILRPLPFKDPGSLVVISAAFPRMKLTFTGLSGPEALEAPEMTHAFAAMGTVVFGASTVRLGTGGTLRANTAVASASTFEVLRPTPVLGRLIEPGDDRQGAAPVVLLGYHFWRRAFGSDKTALGQTLTVEGRPAEIIGVLPPRSELLNRQIDIWMPLMLSRETAGSRADHRFTVIARRKPGVSEESAAADLTRAVAIWQITTGEFHSPAPVFHPLELRSLSEATIGSTARPLAALALSVLLVLSIACANVANLMLSRAEARRTELAVELALGAERRHLAIPYLVEAAVFAAAGGSGGLVLAAFGIDALKAFGPALVRPDDIVMNVRVALVAAGAAMVTAAVIGLVPIARLDLKRARSWLQSGGRGAVGMPDRTRLQHLLIAVQVSLAVALGVAGILTVRSLLALTRVDVGFHGDPVLRTQISLPETPYQQDEQVWSFYERLLTRASAIPETKAVAVMSGLPPLRPANNTTFMLDGSDAIDHTSVPQVEFIQHVSPGYFGAIGVPLRAGRGFSEADTASSAPVAIVNETLARRFWPGESAIGHRLRPAGLGTPWFTVIGIVGDVRQAGLQAPAGAELYAAYRQGRMLLPAFLPRSMNLVLAGGSDPIAFAPAVQQIVRELDPGAAVSGVALMSDVVARTVAQPRLLTALLTAFAAIAVLLSAVGVYGVTSGAVAARTGEFGVRIALGATPRDMLAQVYRTGGRALIVGLLFGSASAFWVVRYLSTVLYGSEPAAIVPIAVVDAGLAFVGAVAMAVPAVRATRVDPLEALRIN